MKILGKKRLSKLFNFAAVTAAGAGVAGYLGTLPKVEALSQQVQYNVGASNNSELTGTIFAALLLGGFIGGLALWALYSVRKLDAAEKKSAGAAPL